MTTPDQTSGLVPAEVAERVDAASDRAAGLAVRASSLYAQVTPGPVAQPRVTSAEQDRLRAAQEVAARFYRAQLDGPDGTGPRRWLAGQGVPSGGRWVLGYAPGRPTALVNELRRAGFTDTEILASGLASTGRGGLPVDRFQDRVMVGVREHRPPHAVVSWVGYAPPGADPSVPAVLHGPATAIHRPADALVGLAEQPERTGREVVVAASALEAIARSAAAGEDAPVVVAPCGPTLTPGQVAVLAEQTDVAAGVTVAIGAGDAGRRAAERAYHLLAPAVQAHPRAPGVLRAVGPRPQDGARPLLEAVVTARVEWAARTYQTPAGRAGVARSARSMLRYQVDAGGVDIAALEAYVAQRLDPEPVATDVPTAPSVLDVPVPAPAVLGGAATAHAPPVVEADVAGMPEGDQDGPGEAGQTDGSPWDGGRSATNPVRDRVSEQLLLDFGEAGAAGRGQADGVRRIEPGLPHQPGRAELGDPDGQMEDPAEADEDEAGLPGPAAVDEPGVDFGQRDDGSVVPAGVNDTVEDAAGQPFAAAAHSADAPEPEPEHPAEEAPPRTLPDGARPVEGVDGYHFTYKGQITVYGPDDAVVATTENVGDGIKAGMVDGVRIPAYGYGSNNFAVLAACQHRAAELPAEQRDRVWIQVVADSTARAGYVVEVHGTVKGDTRDESAAKDAANFLCRRCPVHRHRAGAHPQCGRRPRCQLLPRTTGPRPQRRRPLHQRGTPQQASRSTQPERGVGGRRCGHRDRSRRAGAQQRRP
ncbi:hypothetical protein [Salinispora arenicola]|uniref:hypothetical protein n=1 Tax=Salinispora arenicola TaxID=168697 RepID=UPI00037F233E|nr:hypothetical protein [Salinispora arenicola]